MIWRLIIFEIWAVKKSCFCIARFSAVFLLPDKTTKRLFSSIAGEEALCGLHQFSGSSSRRMPSALALRTSVDWDTPRTLAAL